MDYTDDTCKDFDNGEGFTIGQFRRMLAFWSFYREGDADAPESKPMETDVTGGAVDVYIEIHYDRFPLETSWAIYNSEEVAVVVYAEGDGYGALAGYVSLPVGMYTFYMRDLGNDGTCCLYGIGRYYIQVGDRAVVQDLGIFAFEVVATFEVRSSDSVSGSLEKNESSTKASGASTVFTATLCVVLALTAPAFLA